MLALTRAPIEPGAPADLIVLGDDPLHDLEAFDDIRLVVRAGRVARCSRPSDKHRPMTDSPLADDRNVTPGGATARRANHGMPLEGLRYDVTPVGLHYLLIHFDVPRPAGRDDSRSSRAWCAAPLDLVPDAPDARPAVTTPVTLECAGNGRARLHPRPLSQPWLWRPSARPRGPAHRSRPLLHEAGLAPEAVELVFEGADHGVQGGIEQDYERSLPVAEAKREDVLLAYEVNGVPLPPQHGFPIRLLVPGWYGMTSVKWLRKISAFADPFKGFQMWAYAIRDQADDARHAGHAHRAAGPDVAARLPGVLHAGEVLDAGRARWRAAPGPAAPRSSGSRSAPTAATHGRTRPSRRCRLRTPGRMGHLEVAWEAAPGEYEFVVRATDGCRGVQPLEQSWNHHGLENNVVQRVPVMVRTPRLDQPRPTGRSSCETPVDVVLVVLKKCGLIRSPSPRKSVHTSRASSA